MQVSIKLGNFSINIMYGWHQIPQPMRIVTPKTNILISTNPLGRLSLYDAAFKCVHPARETDAHFTVLQEKKMTCPLHCACSLLMCPSSKIRRWWAQFTVLGAFKWSCDLRENERPWKKDMGRGHDRPPPPPDRHFDYYTKSAEWANWVKI